MPNGKLQPFGERLQSPWATSVSEAIAHGSARKNPVKIFASPPNRVVLFLAKKGNGIRTMVFCVAEWMNPFPTQDNRRERIYPFR